jgi:hypothetical protein
MPKYGNPVVAVVDKLFSSKIEELGTSISPIPRVKASEIFPVFLVISYKISSILDDIAIRL